jgi:hypothetical protein
MRVYCLLRFLGEGGVVSKATRHRDIVRVGSRDRVGGVAFVRLTFPSSHHLPTLQSLIK